MTQPGGDPAVPRREPPAAAGRQWRPAGEEQRKKDNQAWDSTLTDEGRGGESGRSCLSGAAVPVARAVQPHVDGAGDGTGNARAASIPGSVTVPSAWIGALSTHTPYGGCSDCEWAVL